MTSWRFPDAVVLRPVDRMMRAAMQRSREAFAAIVETSLPDGWPQFPEAFSSKASSHEPPWIGYLFMRAGDGALLGDGGFHAPPDDAGVVEIGFEIAAVHRNQGYATLAGRLLTDLAFTNGANAVVAHALDDWNASNAVLQKLGMRFVEEVSDAENGLSWRWRIDRSTADLARHAARNSPIFPYGLR